MKPRVLLVAALVGLAVCMGCTEEIDEPPRFIDKGDLSHIRERGTLRVIVPRLGEGCLPRQGMPAAAERELAESFGERLGVEVEFLCTENRDELLSSLEDGWGDLVAANLTKTPERAARVDFTRPTNTVSDWLVGAKGAPDLPRSMAELDGREVHVRASSSFARTLRRLATEKGLDIRIVPVDENLDTETIVFEVSSGERPLTVADENQLASIESYNKNVERLFPLAEGQQIGWAVRKGNEDLLAAANAFITEHSMTGHRRELSTGDLDAIKSRGVLRVLTTNNAVNYFLYRGQQMGFDYELAKMASDRLGVQLEMVVPQRFEQLIPWLLDGRGDVIAGSLTVTPERQEQIEFSIPYLYVQEVLVQSSARDERLQSINELQGRKVHVQKSSSYYGTLQEIQEVVGSFEIIEVPEELEIEALMTWVADGHIEYTVADSHLLDAELTYRDDIEAAFALEIPNEEDEESSVTKQKSIAFGLRKDNPELKAFLDDFIKSTYRGLEYNVARQRYFEAPHRMRRVKEQRATVSGRVSPYDDIIKKYSKQYGLDWRLMAAQAYEESRFNPRAESWAGAQGLFQVMPATALELGFTDLFDTEVSIHVGIRHMHRLLERLDPRIPFTDRLRFALAAYNAGLGHVLDARRLTRQRGQDADQWFDHVETAMLLLEQPKYYAHARYGYVRGSETVAYVSNVQNRYDHYVSLFPE
jgi:membrane-bound lytic murein transglycosylase F